MALSDIGNEPVPEIERFRVRVVDAEYLDTVVDPEQDHVAKLRPELAPLRGAEIDRKDILVLLRRILRELHAAIGAAREPQRMLAHVWVIRRALVRDVERDLEAKPLRLALKAREVFERAEILVNALVPAAGAADRPGRPRIGAPRLESVIAPFAVIDSDRMDRRQIHHVEAHLGDVREAASRR